MASKVGTIFVELSLDDKIYKQRLGEVLTSSQATAKGVETSFKALGIKSSESFNQQRLAAQNAYTLIKNSATATANDIIRAHEAMTSKINSLNTQQFGQHETLIGKMKANWVGATVAITAAYAAMSGVTNFIRDVAAAYGEQETAESRLRSALAAHGVTSKEVTAIYADYAAQLQEVTIYSDEAILSAMQLLTTMGTGPEKIKPATEAVLSLSYAFGIDLNEAAKAVAQAMEGNYRGLTRLIPALKGVEAGGMSASDVLKLIQRYTGNIAAQEVETYQGKLKQLTNSYGELKEQIGGHVVPALKEMIDATITGIHWLEGLMGAQSTAWKKKEIDLLNKQIEELRKTGSGEDSVALFTRDTQEDINNLIAKRSGLEREVDGILKDQNKTLSEAQKQYKTPHPDFGGKGREEALKAESAANKSYYEERIAKEEQWLKLSKLGAYDDLTTAAEVIERKKSYLNDWYNTEASIIQKQEKNETALEAKLEALWMDYNKKWTDLSGQGDYTAAAMRKKASDDAIEGMKAEIAMGEKKTMDSIRRAQERDQMESGVLEHLQGFEKDYYDLSMRLMNEKAQKMRDLGMSEAEIAVWVADETEKAEIRKAKASNDFFSGLLAGLKETHREMKTWGEAGIDISKTFSDQASKALSEGLFQAITTGTVNTQAIFTTFMDAMLRKVVDTVAAMVVEVAAQKVIAFFGTEWVAGGMDAISSLLGIVQGISGLGNLGGGGEGGGEVDLGASGLVTSMAYGGLVPGSAAGGDLRSNDMIRAMLSPGEFVVPRSVMQAIAGKGKGGDTMLAHINPAEASLLKMLGGAGTINEATGLPEFYTRIVGGEAGSNVYYDQNGNRYDISEWNRGNPLGFGLGKGGWMLTPQEVADLGGHPTRDQIVNYFDSKYPSVMPGAGDLTAEEHSSQAESNPSYFYSRYAAGARPYYDETALKWPYSKEVYDAIMSFRQSRQMPGPPGGFTSWGGQALTLGSMALLSYAGGAVLGGFAADAGWGFAETTGATAVGSAAPRSLLSAAQGNWQGALENIILSGVSSYIAGYVNDYIAGVTESAIASYVGGKLVGLGIKYGLHSAFQGMGLSGSPVKVGMAGVSGAQELGNILADFSGRIAPSSEGVPLLRSGMDYVPRDNYPAILHEGEAVLNKQDASGWRGGKGTTIRELKIYLDGQEVGGRMKVIADGVVVSRNKRMVNAATRVYQ